MENIENTRKFERHGLSIVIEYEAGSYRDFETEGDPVWDGYPLKGVTYPVPYGYIEGYTGEDGADLDIFVGTGDRFGYVLMERRDVPIETKFFLDCTDEEAEKIFEIYKLVLAGSGYFKNKEEFMSRIDEFKK